MKRVDGITTLRYNHDADSKYDTADLLKDGKGRCGAWARFLRDTIIAQGASATVVAVTNNAAAPPPPPGASLTGVGIVVKACPAQGSGGTNYSRVSFTDHAVVESSDVPNTIFDPSYGQLYWGMSLQLAESYWEDACLDKLSFFYSDGSSVFPPQDPNIKELLFTPTM